MLLVFTGNGKGKTTAALGCALRAVGHGMRVYFAQFMKKNPSGEIVSSRKLDGRLKVLQGGARGFLLPGRPVEPHRKAALKTLESVRRAIASDRYGMVVMDEVCVALSLGLLSKTEVVPVLARRDKVHVIATGRGAPQWLVKMADTATKMEEVKHAFRAGRKAAMGLEY
jgi:cob(I)alamin adenosyltransferase